MRCNVLSVTSSGVPREGAAVKSARSMLVLSILAGLATSVAGSFAYAYLASLKTPGLYTAGTLLLVATVAIFAYVFRGRWFVLTRSGIRGYYPDGQRQCERSIASELRRTRAATFVGARGMDLIGEGSLFPACLAGSKTLEKVEVFLLTPGSKNSRLRSEHLEVERNKYVAEGQAVDNFVGFMRLSQGIPVAKYSYTERPQVRLIITDFSAWVGFYRPALRGRELPIYRIAGNGVLAKEVNKYVETLRASAELRSYGTLERE